MHAIYNNINCNKKKCLMLKSYLPGINTSIFPKIHYENILSGKIVNKLHAWIENHPHVVNYHNVSDSLFVKINGTIVNKKESYT